MIYDIFISLVVVIWAFIGILFGVLTIGEPSRHAANSSIIVLIFFVYFCAMLGPFSSIFLLIKKLSN